MRSRFLVCFSVPSHFSDGLERCKIEKEAKKRKWKGKKMFSRQSLHVAMLVWGMVFSLLAALCMFLSKNFDREKRRWMIAMQLACALLLGNDALAWGYRGFPGEFGNRMVRMSNMIVFLMWHVLLLLFNQHMCSYLFPDREERKSIRRVQIVNVLAVIGFAMVVVSQFTDLYYYIDAANFYHRTKWNFVNTIGPFVGMMLEFSLLIQYRDRISAEIFTSMISYIILPIVSMVVQIFYYGISLANIAITVSMLLMFLASTMEQNQTIAIQEKRAADLRIKLMMSQIAPHFIYNTLTTIKVLCVKDPIEAQNLVSDFAMYLRGNLDSLEKTSCIPFSEELKHVKCYLSIEKTRFMDRLHVEYDLNAQDFQLPALTLQPLVENAVKHGICKKPKGGTIWIRTEEKDGTVYLLVEDDGIGFDQKELESKKEKFSGLENVKKRVKEMCAGTFIIESESGKGTKAEIILPQKGRTNENNSSR